MTMHGGRGRGVAMEGREGCGYGGEEGCGCGGEGCGYGREGCGYGGKRGVWLWREGKGVACLVEWETGLVVWIQSQTLPDFSGMEW